MATVRDSIVNTVPVNRLTGVLSRKLLVVCIYSFAGFERVQKSITTLIAPRSFGARHPSRPDPRRGGHRGERCKCRKYRKFTAAPSSRCHRSRFRATTGINRVVFAW